MCFTVDYFYKKLVVSPSVCPSENYVAITSRTNSVKLALAGLQTYKCQLTVADSVTYHYVRSAVRCTGRPNSLIVNFLSNFSDRASDGGSTSASDSTRDDAFRGLFSNRLDDFMDSTSSTGDIFPPPLASSRSGWPQKSFSFY